MTGPLKSDQFSIGDRVEHRQSGWSGTITRIRGDRVTVRPTHPRPQEVFDKVSGAFKPTPDDWEGWAPLTVTAHELEKL